MKARITIHTYKDEIKTYTGTVENSNGMVTVTFPPETNIQLTGLNKENDIILKGDDHIAELHWKNSWTLQGKWKSTNGEWKKITLSMKDIKHQKEQLWWNKDDFSDIVDTTLIAMFEKKRTDKDMHLHRSQKPTNKEIKFLKTIGPTFSPGGYSRSNQMDLANKFIDNSFSKDKLSIKNPIQYIPQGIISNCNLSDQDDKISEELQDEVNWTDNPKDSIALISGMLFIYFIKPFNHKFKSFDKGRNFILYTMVLKEQGGLYIDKEYFRMTSSKIIPCFSSNAFKDQKYVSENGLDVVSSKSAVTNAIEIAGRLTEVCDVLNGYHSCYDMWKVRAHEDIANATFGVDDEQIKSLFYSREEPLTPTGRRRPIIHWIRSHQRRIKRGIDIDLVKIPKSIRGVRDIVMNGTKFSIFPNI